MPTSFCRSLPIAGVAALMTGAPAVAATHATPAPRVRPETAETQALFDDLVAHSPTARALVAELQQSDLLIYIRHQAFTVPTLDGRTGLVLSGAPTRVVIIELSTARTYAQQLVALGHELQHAAEIAEAAEVVDTRSLAAYYERIGTKTALARGAVQFETVRAQQAASRIRREVFGDTARTSHERD